MRASVQLGYFRTGNRTDFETPHFARRARLGALVLAECAEDRGRFLDAIVDGIWLICEETYWGCAATLFMQQRDLGLPDVTEPIVDLFVGETGALLAWTHYLLGPRLDAISPLITERIRVEIERRLLTPCLLRDDFWWMGWHRDNRSVNNWYPWICCNWLTCVLLLETDPRRRVRAVHKIMRTLDVFIDYANADGSCDEGPLYWSRAGASLFECLDLLHVATAGQLDFFAEPLIRDLGRFVATMHVAGPWFVNFADAPAKPSLEAILPFLYGRRIHDAQLTAFGAALFQQNPRLNPGHTMGRVLLALWNYRELTAATAAPALPRDVWFPVLEVMTARDAADSTNGWFLAAKAGHNLESHNHNDCGTLFAYLDGWPVLLDIGVEAYTRQTFSPQRYEIWTMQSQWHNLPTVNGCLQHDGREFAAHDVAHHADDTTASLAMDLAAAWPADAALVSWRRTVRLERGRAITVTDDYRLTEVRAPTVFNFLTTRPLDLGTPGEVRFGAFPEAPASRGARLAYDAVALAAEVDTIELTDVQLRATWGPRLFRLRLTERTPSLVARREFRLTALA